MKVWEEIYGADYDGNRGVKMTFWELDGSKSEREEIAEIIYESFIEGTSSGTLKIELQGIEDVEVEIEEYIDELLAIAKADKTIEDDLETQLWLRELEFDLPQNKLCF